MVDPALTSSRLAAVAAGHIPVTTETAMDDGHCTMCAGAIRRGERYMPASFGRSFTDRAYLAAPSSLMLCGHCAAIRDKLFLQTLSSSVVTRDAFYRFASNNDRAWFFLNPPEPPFIAYTTNAQMQHLIWRTPVSWSRDVFHVRYGHNLLTIRHARLLRGLKAARRLVTALNADTTSGKKRKSSYTLRSPFSALDRELSTLEHGYLRQQLRQMAATNQDIQLDVALVESLNAGELWALTALLYVESPTQPVPIIVPKQ
jgi:CRISPR type IV-associated protein Csf1